MVVGFKTMTLESMRAICYAVDKNHDGAISKRELRSAAKKLETTRPNFSAIFTNIADDLNSGNSRLDGSGDGKLRYAKLGRERNGIDELAILAARAKGDKDKPDQISVSDFQV